MIDSPTGMADQDLIQNLKLDLACTWSKMIDAPTGMTYKDLI